MGEYITEGLVITLVVILALIANRYGLRPHYPSRGAPNPKPNPKARPGSNPDPLFTKPELGFSKVLDLRGSIKTTAELIESIEDDEALELLRSHLELLLEAEGKYFNHKEATSRQNVG